MNKPRSFLPLCAACLLASATVDAAEKGQIGINLKMTPGFGVRSRDTFTGLYIHPGLSYQLTDHVALRPALGIGKGGDNLFLRTGLSGFYHLHPKRSWTPYLGGGLTYSYSDQQSSVLQPDGSSFPWMPGPAPSGYGPHFMTVTTAGGVEYTINRRFALFAELGAAYTLGQQYEWTGSEWRKVSGFRGKAPFRSGFGLPVRLR